MAGEDRWFKLEPRSSASRVQGDCQLALKLITTQVGSHGERGDPCPASQPATRAGLVTGRPCVPEGHGHEPARAVGLPVLPAAAQPTAAVRAPSPRGSGAVGTPGWPVAAWGRRAVGNASGRGWRSPATTHAWPLPQPNSSSWRGELSGPAATVLCLHGAQSNLSALQLAVL